MLRAFINSFVLSFFIVFIFWNPFIRYLKLKKFGEEIKEEGPSSHYSKGTPTMGGVLIVATVIIQI